MVWEMGCGASPWGLEWTQGAGHRVQGRGTKGAACSGHGRGMLHCLSILHLIPFPSVPHLAFQNPLMGCLMPLTLISPCSFLQVQASSLPLAQTWGEDFQGLRQRDQEPAKKPTPRVPAAPSSHGTFLLPPGPAPWRKTAGKFWRLDSNPD